MTEQAEPADTDVSTGPIRLPAQYSGLLDAGGFEDVPTPPSGTHLSPTPPSGTRLPPVPHRGAPRSPVPAPYQPGLSAPRQAHQPQAYRQQQYQRPYPQQPQPPRQKPPMGAPRTERESVLALFLVHMFPIGHLPVAAARPAEQLPIPAETDAVGRAPFDHPDSALLDDSDALYYVTRGLRRTPTPPAAVEPPAELLTGYEPEAEPASPAGPPAAQFPEGGLDHTEPVVLPKDTLLDRFGGEHGRVFAADGTPFAKRSLPPSAVDEGYRRYRVVKPVPMWRSTSAEWFGQPGGGIRYRAVLAADELVTLGFLAEVTGEKR
ncbi:TNT domain-containing protein [Amycolatopsis sp. NBC_01480]|uniref:TNT domain-containing protein n=1 Tax=Amycolatopsis sp. NBC_01480 TaxID=2903562 RepID=UPI002E2A0D0B|nr:TNT domain-containing protein [Amycolatopsis sp. NBC_01480]